MRINKNYDIAKLAEELRAKINVKKNNGVVRMDILTANDILDVLEETQRREQKHQTLESALTFIEKEDGTQTNEMELHNNKPDCFGICRPDAYECSHCLYYGECTIKTQLEAEDRANG